MPAETVLSLSRPGRLTDPGRHRVAAFDALRGILALWVVLHHAVVYTALDLDAFPARILVRHGQEAVIAFFVLSGYAICTLLLGHSRGFLPFMAERVARIFPVYLVVLLFGTACWFLHPPFELMPWLGRAGPHLQHWPPHGSEGWWLHLILHLFQAHGTVPDSALPYASTSLLPPAWSLSTEFQFYLLAPALSLLIVRAGRWANLVLAVLLVAATCLSAAVGRTGLSHASIAWYLPLFVVGMLGAVLRPGMLRRVAAYAAIVMLTAAAFATMGRPYVANALVVWLVVWAASATGAAHSLLASSAGRALLWLGAVSYPLYLVHYPIQQGSLVLLVRFVRPESGTIVLAWFVGSTVLSLAAAWLLHRKVEAPGQRLGKAWAQRLSRAS